MGVWSLNKRPIGRRSSVRMGGAREGNPGRAVVAAGRTREEGEGAGLGDGSVSRLAHSCQVGGLPFLQVFGSDGRSFEIRFTFRHDNFC